MSRHLTLFSRRAFIKQGGVALVGGGLALAGGSLLTSCGSGTQGSDGEAIDTLNGVLYVTRMSQTQTAHYDYTTGDQLDVCPGCEYDIPVSDGSPVYFGTVFETDDQSAFSGAEPSDFTPSGRFAHQTGGKTARATVQQGTRAIIKPGRDFGFSFFRLFYVEGGRVETHKLSPCVEVQVLHTHFTIKRRPQDGDRQAWMHLHLGVYRDGPNRCYVIFDNLHKWICYQICFPDQNGLGFQEVHDLWYQALEAGFAAVGVAAAGWLISAAATVLATSSLPLLLTL